MKQRLQQKVIASKATAPVAVVLVLLCWLAGASPSAWQQEGVCLLAGAASAWLLVEMNNTFSLLDKRTAIHAVIFLLVWASVPRGSHLPEATLLALAVLWAGHLLFGCYQCGEPVGRVFRLFLIVSGTSLLVPPALWTVPLFYASLLVFKALSARSFFAGVAGLLFPYWLLFVYAFYQEDLALFYAPLQSLFSLPGSGEALSVGGWLAFGFLSALSLAGAAYVLANNHHNKIRTRVFLRFFLWLQGICLLAVALHPAAFPLLSGVMAAVCGVLAARLFTFAEGRVANISFIVSVVMLLLIIGCNLWTPSYNFF